MSSLLCREILLATARVNRHMLEYKSMHTLPYTMAYPSDKEHDIKRLRSNFDILMR